MSRHQVTRHDRTVLNTLVYRCALAVFMAYSLLTTPSKAFPFAELEDSKTDSGSDDETRNQAAVQVLRQNCVACHGPEKQEGGFRADSQQAIVQGGTQSRNRASSHLRKSLLMNIILGKEPDLEMPPKKPLGAADRQVLQSWIEAGAPWPKATASPAPPEDYGVAWEDPENPVRVRFNGQRLDLWSLRPIQRPSLPVVNDPNWAMGPIDLFLLESWDAAGLIPGPDVDRRDLLRRWSMDLIGLMPDPDKLETWMVDSHGRELSEWIDELISSPQYGIHVGRQWLDVVRYSDSNGFDWDEFRPQAWRYRDYVISAFNRDLPYDQFIEHQLAGDERLTGPPKNADEQQMLVATGFLRSGPHDNAAPLFNEQDRSRAELLADLTETTGSAFLGLTLGCCRCHDHKTDPLLQEDHYRLRAFFANVEFADQLPIDLEALQQSIASHNIPFDAKLQEIEKAIKALAPEAKDERKTLEKERANVKSEMRSYTHAMLMTDSQKDVAPTHVLVQGDHRTLGNVVSAGFPTVLYPGQSPILAPTNPLTKGLRLTLANWMTRESNPWTARVIVNRLWQSHFGIGLVASPNDFGMTGSPPSNPKLLDWLASELIRSEWSIKHIQRLIVSSHAYRQSAIPRNHNAIPGAEASKLASCRNHLRRLSAEQMRDALLTASGLLQHYSGGPPIWPELPAEVLQANPAFLDDNAMKTKGWYPSPDSLQSVRSIFLIQKRTVRVPMLETFDLPENSVSCPQRDCSIVAPQALNLLNGNLMLQAATAMSKRCEQKAPIEPGSLGTTKMVQYAFRLAYQRLPNLIELEWSLEFLAKHSLVDFCRVLMNANEFAFNH